MKSYLLGAACLMCLLVASCNNGTYYAPVTNPSTGPLSGYLISRLLIAEMGPDTLTEQDAAAIFFANPGDSTFVLVDSVRINGELMDIDGNNVGYIAINGAGSTTPNLDMSSSANWSVSGSSGIPSFSYSHVGDFPKYTGPLPDTISISAGYTFQLNPVGTNFQNSPDSCSIVIPDNSTGGYVTATVPMSTSAVSFSSSQLAAMSPGINTIVIYAFKVVDKTFSGKTFRFLKGTQRSRTITVVP